MKTIRELEADLELGIAGLEYSILPPEIEGLKSISVEGFKPMVSVYIRDSADQTRRRVSGEEPIGAFASSRCEIVIQYAPAKDDRDVCGDRGGVGADRVRFEPVRIRGGMISDTVIEDRGR